MRESGCFLDRNKVTILSIYSRCKPLTQRRWLLLVLVTAIKIRPEEISIHSLGFRKVMGNPIYCMWHFFSFEFLIQLYSSEAVIPDNFCIFYSIKYIYHIAKNLFKYWVLIIRNVKKNPIENFVIFSSGRSFFYLVELIMHQG